jgi:hypothetical protein
MTLCATSSYNLDIELACSITHHTDVGTSEEPDAGLICCKNPASKKNRHEEEVYGARSIIEEDVSIEHDSPVEQDAAALEGDVAALEGDVAALKGDVAALEGDVAALEAHAAALEVRTALVEPDAGSSEKWGAGAAEETDASAPEEDLEKNGPRFSLCQKIKYVAGGVFVGLVTLTITMTEVEIVPMVNQD